VQLVGIQIYNLNIARIKNNTKNNNNVIVVPLAVPLGSSLSLSLTPSLKLALSSHRAPKDISKLKQYMVIGPRRVLDTKTD
jgi:hypothetical protein